MIKNLSVLAFLFLFIGAKAAIPQSEKQSLYAIAAALNKTFNWNEQTAVEEWRGVTVTNISGQDHVTGLEINTNFTTSAFLSDQVANLAHLQKLRFSFLVVNSTTNITVDLNYIQNLQALVDLQIENRAAFPDSREELLILNPGKMTLLSNLEHLDIKIKHSQFTLPAAVTNLSKLKKLTYHNPANNTYPDIFAMNSLVEIDLSATVFNISESYSIISNNNNLNKLSLKGIFPQLPAGFYNIPNLETLVINSTMYSFPTEISNYAGTLKNLSFYRSLINEPNIAKLTKLEALTLQGDTVQLQSWIGLLTNLKSLYVFGTNVSVDSSAAQLSLLEYLHFSSNDTVSENIYTIPNLKTLILSTRNNVSESVGNLTKLEFLQVQSNGVLTALPTSIINTTTLKKVDFIRNTGDPNRIVPIPTGYFTNWPDLEQFWIMHRVENFDVTNRFVNNPKLKQLTFWNWSDLRSNIFGALNLCQNPNLNHLWLEKNNISEVDMRNVSSITADNFETMQFTDSPISKFVVDDVNHFNSLVSQGRIKIQLAAPGGYSVETSSYPCQKGLSVNSAQAQTTQLYPNPVSDILSFSTTRKVTEVEVFSASGQKFAVDTYNNKADLSSLSSGLYFVRWKEDGVYKTDKIIKK